MKSALVSGEIAEPYAQALMSLAQSQNLVDQIGEDIASLLNVLKESADLRACLSSPLFDAASKKAVLKQVLGEQVHPYTLNFLMLLADRGRISLLKEVCDQYQTLLRRLKQTVLAEVVSAIELSEAQQEGIRQKVIAVTQAHQVDLDIRIDPDLIGGVIIKVGSQVYDASLRGQLRRIGMRLSNAT